MIEGKSWIDSIYSSSSWKEPLKIGVFLEGIPVHVSVSATKVIVSLITGQLLVIHFWGYRKSLHNSRVVVTVITACSPIDFMHLGQ